LIILIVSARPEAEIVDFRGNANTATEGLAGAEGDGGPLGPQVWMRGSNALDKASTLFFAYIKVKFGLFHAPVHCYENFGDRLGGSFNIGDHRFT
jgi:hypothetical protein